MEETSSDRKKEYLREYYRKNKELLAEKKRDRYQNDPEYRKSSSERSKKYAKAKREKYLEQVRLGIIIPDKKNRQYYAEVRGEKLLAYNRETIAKRTCKSYGEIRLLQSKGFIPRSPFNGTQSCMVYTDGMIDVIRTVLDRYKRFEMKHKTVIRTAIINGWSEIGVYAEILEGDFEDGQ